MKWRTVLQLINCVLVLNAGWLHLYCKFVQYRVKDCVKNETLLKSTKNCANSFGHFEDMGIVKHSGLTLMAYRVVFIARPTSSIIYLILYLLPLERLKIVAKAYHGHSYESATN